MGFLIGWFWENQIYNINRSVLQECSDFTWMGFVLTLTYYSCKRIYSPGQSSDIMRFINYFIIVLNSSILLYLNLKYKHINGKHKTNNQIGEKVPFIIKGGATSVYPDGSEEIK